MSLSALGSLDAAHVVRWEGGGGFESCGSANQDRRQRTAKDDTSFVRTM